MDKKSMQQLIVLLPVLLIGGIFGYYKYLLLPLKEQQKILDTELDKIYTEYKDSVARAARLPQLEKEIAALNLEISQMQKKLPLSKDVPGLIRMLSKKMDNHNILWSRLAPGSQNPRDYYIEHAYTIPFKTTYHNLARFLADVGQMERIFATRFPSLNVQEDAKLGIIVTGEITFLIYTARS